MLFFSVCECVCVQPLPERKAYLGAVLLSLAAEMLVGLFPISLSCVDELVSGWEWSGSGRGGGGGRKV